MVDDAVALFGAEPPRTESYIVCRGVVPVSEIPEALYSQSVTMWGGPELDLFHYPLRRGKIYNIWGQLPRSERPYRR